MSEALDSALAIARGLVDDALWHAGRCTWVGPEPGVRNDRMCSSMGTLGPDLYSGTAGIGLVLAETCAATGDESCRRTARAALRQSLEQAERVEPAFALGLFTGTPGIALAAIRGGVLLGEEPLVHKGLEMASRVGTGTVAAEAWDLIAGGAGAVVALLCIVNEVGDIALLGRAADLGEDILAAAARRGAWHCPSSGPGSGVLRTGMAHGVSGLALALAELGDAVNDDRFRRAAGRALEEEDTAFDARIGNWHRAEAPTAHRHGTVAQAAFINWCHGAPGIGLANHRAWTLTRDDRSRRRTEAALRATSRWLRAALGSGRGGFTLCHGLAGNAEMLAVCADAARSGRADLRGLAEDVAETGLAEYARRGRTWPDASSPGLMCGLAGVARFYLGRHDARIGTMLLPSTCGPRVRAAAAM